MAEMRRSLDPEPTPEPFPSLPLEAWVDTKETLHRFVQFDLAYTRFSGRAAPPLPDADAVTREAYSQEVISFGFWPGSGPTPFPAVYSYTAPEPANLRDQPLQPAGAYWFDSGRGSLALLKYEELRQMPSPTAAMFEFLESAYQAGVRTAGWPADELAWKPPPA